MEDKLLISPIFKSSYWLRRIGYRGLVQNKIFKCGVKIKNINDKPFEGGLIKNIRIVQSESNPNNAIAMISNLEFIIPSLNPEEVKEIWFENMKIPFSEGAWFELDIESKKELSIHFWDASNNSYGEHGKNKHWRHLLYIESKQNILQIFTNYLLVFLTIILVITGLVGLIINISN